MGHGIEAGLGEKLRMRDSEKLVGLVEYSSSKVGIGALTRTKLVAGGQND